ALIVITAGDVGYWGISYVYAHPPLAIRKIAGAVPRTGDRGVRVRSASGLGNQLVLRGYEVVPGYLGLYPATVNLSGGQEFRVLAGAQWQVDADGTMSPLSDFKPRARLVAAS